MRTWINPFISVKFRYFWDLMEYHRIMWNIRELEKMYMARFVIAKLKHDLERIFPMKEQAYAK